MKADQKHVERFANKSLKIKAHRSIFSCTQVEKHDLKPNVYFSNKGRSKQSILFQCLHCGLINQIKMEKKNGNNLPNT